MKGKLGEHKNDLPPSERANYLLLIPIPGVNGKLVGFHLNILQGSMSFHI
jgi:hypothetical protein